MKYGKCVGSIYSLGVGDYVGGKSLCSARSIYSLSQNRSDFLRTPVSKYRLTDKQIEGRQPLLHGQHLIRATTHAYPSQANRLPERPNVVWECRPTILPASPLRPGAPHPCKRFQVSSEHQRAFTHPQWSAAAISALALERPRCRPLPHRRQAPRRYRRLSSRHTRSPPTASSSLRCPLPHFAATRTS